MGYLWLRMGVRLLLRTQTWRFVGKLLLIGAIIWLGVGLLSRAPFRIGAWLTPRYQTAPSPAVIVERLQSLSRLETARQTTTHVVEVQASNGLPAWLAGERVLLIAQAEVVAGIDLSQLRKEHIRVQGDRVSLLLPPPQIFSVYLNEYQTRVYDRQRGIFVLRPDREIESRARQQALQEARETALRGNLLTLARQNALEQITKLLKEVGVQKVEIEFQVAHQRTE